MKKKEKENNELVVGVKLVTKFLNMLVESESCDKDIRITKEDAETMKEKLSSFIVEKDEERDFILSDDVLSVSELFWLIDNGHVSNLLLGKKVFIHNLLCESKNWVIIGVNHDGTKNTVDLRAEVAALKVDQFGDSNYYEDSTLDKALVKMSEGFPEPVKDRMQVMDVMTNGSVIERKIKALSMTELGLEDYSDYIEKGEGNPYPFPTHMIKDKDGEYTYHVTRSRGTGSSTYVWGVSSGGGVSASACSGTYSVVPAIRLS